MTPPVVHVTSHYPPYLGGLEKVVESLATYRHQRGREVTVLTSSMGGGRPVSDAEFVERFRAIEVAHTTIMPRLPVRLLGLPTTSVVHLHFSQAFAPEAVYLAHRVRHLPYIVHLHIDVGPSGAAGFLLGGYKPKVLGPVLRAAAAVVVFTMEQRRAVVSTYGVEVDRVHVIPNGVDDSFYFDGVRRLHQRPRLLFVGRLAVQKNVPMLLRALEGISDAFDTTLVGEGELEGELRSLANSLELENVNFHGRADGRELRAQFENADLLVLPSGREGMPLVLLEAMAMGLPVVATDIPGTRDVVVDGETGVLVPPGDHRGLREALVYLTSDQTRHIQMSGAARSRSARYRWSAVGEEFEELYARVQRRGAVRTSSRAVAGAS